VDLVAGTQGQEVSPCNHIIGYEWDYSMCQVSDLLARPARPAVTYNFCPTCGAPIDVRALVLDARREAFKRDADEMERRRLMRWPT
jgi:hypothetical protein